MSRRAAFLLLALPLVSLGCLGGTLMENETRPWEGTWRLVRIDGQSLPYARDSVQIVSESVTFLLTGSGFLTDNWRLQRNTSAPVNRTCTSWFGYTVTATAFTLSPTTQPIQGDCTLTVLDRRFSLDGDTLRATGGNGFPVNGVTRLYVR